MKGFKDSTKTQMGHTFTRTVAHVQPHTRNLPVRKAPMVRDTDMDGMAKGGMAFGKPMIKGGKSGC